jgi:hypothetical protein
MHEAACVRRGETREELSRDVDHLADGEAGCVPCATAASRRRGIR